MLRITLITAVLLSLLVSSCRKGENDPFLSLRTRKARVAGSWVMVSGSGSTVTANPASTNTEAWSFDGTTKNYTTTYTDTSGTTSSGFTEPYKFLCAFDKDGSFMLTEIIYTDAVTRKGTWNFNDPPGRKDDRTMLMLSTNWLMSPFGDVQTFEGAHCPVNCYDINELRNKRMVLTMEGSITERGTTTTKKATIVLEQE